MLNRWADNRVRRNGLAYVLVPERHKDGAIHLHGFFTESVPLLDSGTMKLPGAKRRGVRAMRSSARNGRPPVQSLCTTFRGGRWGSQRPFRWMEHMRRPSRIAANMSGKRRKRLGGRWFFRGGKLGKPVVEYAEVDVNDVAACEGAYTFTAGGHMFALLRGKGVETCVSHPEESSLQFSESEIAEKCQEPKGCGDLSHDSESEKKRKGLCGTMRTEYLLEREVERVMSALMPSNRLVCKVCLHGPAGQRRFVAAPVADREAILDCGAEDGEAASGQFAGQVDFGAAFGIRWD